MAAERSDVPIYQLFVEQAKTLEPRFLCDGYSFALVGWRHGPGRVPRVDARRPSHALNLSTIRAASEVFPGVGLKGGVCYFLWDRGTMTATAWCHNDSRTATSSGRIPRQLERVRRFRPRCNAAVVDPARRSLQSRARHLSTRYSRETRSSALDLELRRHFSEKKRHGDVPLCLHPNDEARCRLHRSQGSDQE